ncbi:MAG: HXXEE domain-containing protein [Rhodanobacter sp.]|nr:MAG: HXXEE domain-containing protein [Rhodanobacter sp.]
MGTPGFLLPLFAGLLHVGEEFVWPGGFLAWHRRYRPELSRSITARNAMVLNTVLIAACMVLAGWGSTMSSGASLWLVVASILAMNAVFHFLGMIRSRRYSPGVVTGALVCVPLCLWGFRHMLAHGAVGPRMAVESLLLGASYQLWSMFHHRLRARA